MGGSVRSLTGDKEWHRHVVEHNAIMPNLYFMNCREQIVAWVCFKAHLVVPKLLVVF